jgi:DNA transformation protein
MSQLSKLPNIGKALEQQLKEVGIDTIEQLRETGSKQCWLKIRAIDTSACINRLYALEGAIQGIRWHYLSDEIKSQLKDFYALNTSNT